MKYIAAIIVFLFILFSTISYGQTNVNSKRKPAKATSSSDVNKSSSKTIKKNNEVKSSSHKLVSGKKMPADFPKFVNTGNKEKDAASHKAAKLKWRNENPEKYNSIFRNNSSK